MQAQASLEKAALKSRAAAHADYTDNAAKLIWRGAPVDIYQTSSFVGQGNRDGGIAKDYCGCAVLRRDCAVERHI